jgi:hypothetical protein
VTHRIEFGSLHRSRKITCFVFFTAFLVGSAVAQKAAKPTGPKYDSQTEAKIKGTIEEVKLPPKGSEKDIAHLVVKTDKDTIDVYLCPKSFFDDMGMTFAKGDEISLTGSKIKLDDADVVLVKELVKGTDTFVLRDAKGNPVWN